MIDFEMRPFKKVSRKYLDEILGIAMDKLIENGIRPKCEVPGCCNDAQYHGKSKTGKKVFRTAVWVKEKYNVRKGYICGNHYYEEISKRKGFGGNIAEWKNSHHKYRKHRKDYCENRDGRLGFKCTFTPPTIEELDAIGVHELFKGWLDVDHLDGNPDNCEPENVQTLCKCCHSIKTNMNKDYATEGRDVKRRKKLARQNKVCA